MMIHDYVRIMLREPGASKPISKFVQDRILFEYRNKGFGIFLERGGIDVATNAVQQGCGASPPSTKPSRVVPTTASRCTAPHGLVIETISQLRAVHQPTFIYDVGLRPSYNIPTYQAFLGVVADPHEPFYHWTDAQNHKDFYHHLTGSEREWIRTWAKEAYNGCGSSPSTRELRPRFVFKDQQLRVDCVAISEDCAALLTTCNELTEQFIADFAGLGHVAFAFLGHCEHERYKTSWGRFFDRRKFPPRLYIGVGPSEFGNGDDVVDSLELRVMAQRVGSCPTSTSVSLPRHCTIAAPLRALAKQLGVTLLQRHEMRYYVVRG
jgi:hypothetical protein